MPKVSTTKRFRRPVKGGPFVLARRDKQQSANELSTEVQPMISKLKSVDANDRLMALSAITAMIADPALRTTLLKQDLVRIVMKQNLHSETLVEVAEACGLLRNLVFDMKQEVALFLVRSDILTAVNSIIDKIIGSSEASSDIAQLSENLFGLILALSLSTDSIFEKVLKQSGEKIAQVCSLLLKNHSSLPQSLIATILELLFTLSEDNEEFLKRFSSSSVADTISAFAVNEDRSVSPLAQIYANGILLSSSYDDADPAKILSRITDISSHIGDVNQHLAVINSDDSTEDAIQSSALIVETVSAGLDVIAMAAEALGLSADEEIAAGDVEGSDEDADMDLDDNEEEDDLVEFERDMDALHNAEVEDLQKVNDGDVPPVVDYLIHTAMNNEFTTLALRATNNVFHAMAQQKLKVPARYVSEIFKILTTTDDAAAITPAAGALWAIISSNPISISPEQLNLLIEKLNSAKSTLDSEQFIDEVCQVVILFGTITKPLESVEVTSSFLFALLNDRESPAPVLIETVNALFEIFNDKNLPQDEPLFVQKNRLTELQNLLPHIKQTIKKVDKIKFPEVRAKGDEMTMNLWRFIEYKRKEQKK